MDTEPTAVCTGLEDSFRMFEKALRDSDKCARRQTNMFTVDGWKAKGIAVSSSKPVDD